MGIPGHFHQVAGDEAFIHFAELPILVLHQGLLYPAIPFLLAAGQLKGDRLGAPKKLSNGFDGGQLF